MPSFNKVVLMGHLTRDPQIKYLPSQTAIVEFGLAVNRKFKTGDGQMREDVLFVDCAAFGKTGEAINKYCTKGKPLFVEGRLKFDSWEDKQSGGNRSKLSVVVESFQFIGGRESSDNGGGSEPERQHTSMAGAAREKSKANTPTEPAYDEPQFKEDDIPF